MADAVGRRVDAAWVARMGAGGTRVLGLVLVLALVFTMVNVQQFAAAGQSLGSFQWWIAWLLDPMASITMGAAIVYEGLLADFGRTVGWLTATKWYAGIATWAMNIWVSLVGVIPSGVLLHSVAPGLVLLLAEAAPRVRAHLAEITVELTERDATRCTVDEALPAPPAPPVYEPAAARPTWVAPPPSPAWASGVEVIPDLAPAPVVEDLRVPEPPDGTPDAETPEAEAPSLEPVLVGVIPLPVEVPTAGEPTTEDELDVAVRQLLDDAATAGIRPPGRHALAKVLGPWATPDRIRRSLRRVEPIRVLARNGSGPGAGQQQVTGAGGQ
jgi:hypothetical protein